MLAPPHCPSRCSILLGTMLVAIICGVGCRAIGFSRSSTAGEGSAKGKGTTATKPRGLDLSLFTTDALAAPITQVECTLESGKVSTCYRVVIKGAPTDHKIGPFCPRHIDDGPDVTGLWFESGAVYDLDGAFVARLAEFYRDPHWQLYDKATGKVRVTTTKEACEAAARPDVAPEYNNYCVECALAYVDGGVQVEALIPVTPVPRAEPAELGRTTMVGVSLNGAHYAPPAPVEAILSAYTIAAFDDCGGHINTHEGYHYHAATGCPKEVAQPDGHAPLIGYVIDGYSLHAMASDDGGEEPDDLDACRGHSDDVRGYHYHAASPGENMFIGCFHGETVRKAQGSRGGPRGRPGRGGVASCADVKPGSPCCGDKTCDGPETTANCPVDCS